MSNNCITAIYKTKQRLHVCTSSLQCRRFLETRELAAMYSRHVGFAKSTTFLNLPLLLKSKMAAIAFTRPKNTPALQANVRPKNLASFSSPRHNIPAVSPPALPFPPPPSTHSIRHMNRSRSRTLFSEVWISSFI